MPVFNVWHDIVSDSAILRFSLYPKWKQSKSLSWVSGMRKREQKHLTSNERRGWERRRERERKRLTEGNRGRGEGKQGRKQWTKRRKKTTNEIIVTRTFLVLQEKVLQRKCNCMAWSWGHHHKRGWWWYSLYVGTRDENSGAIFLLSLTVTTTHRTVWARSKRIGGEKKEQEESNGRWRRKLHETQTDRNQEEDMKEKERKRWRSRGQQRTSNLRREDNVLRRTEEPAGELFQREKK